MAIYGASYPPRPAQPFKPGDLVQLVKPFACGEDDPEDDKEFDENIRASGNQGEILAEWTHGYRIRWEGAGVLVCNWDVVDLIYPPVTSEEEEQALQSILRAKE